MHIKLKSGTDRHKPGSRHDVAAIVPAVRPGAGRYQYLLYDGTHICETIADLFVTGYGQLTLGGYAQPVEKELDPCAS